MSEPNNSAWPFSEITESEGFDIDAIFGTGNSAAAQADSFAAPAQHLWRRKHLRLPLQRPHRLLPLLLLPRHPRLLHL